MSIDSPALGVDAWPRLARVVRTIAAVQDVRVSDVSDMWITACPLHPVAGVMDLMITPDFAGRAMLECARHCEAERIARAVGADLRDVVSPPLPPDPVEGLPRAIRAIDAPEPEPITWVVEELLVAGELAVFAGDGGSFKSTAAFHIAGAVAGGYSAFNRFPATPRPALILSAEDGAGVVMNRLDAIVAGHGWDRERVLSNVHIIATHDAKLSDAAWQQHLLDEARRIDVGFVVCDPLFDLVEGDENSNSELRPVVKYLRKLAAGTNASVVVVHHAAKVKPDQRAIDRVRGATALRDAARCVLFFESRPEGIAIEHLKMSRSERLAPFMLTRDIESTPDSRAIWSSARFTFQTTNEAVLSRAESFVLDQVTMSPAVLKTADLRVAGAGVGIRGEDISKALTLLQARGLIDYEPAPRNSKLWFPREKSSLSTSPGQAQNSEPVHPVQSLSNRLRDTTSEPVHPALPTGGRQGGHGDRSGQAGQARSENGR